MRVRDSCGELGEVLEGDRLRLRDPSGAEVGLSGLEADEGGGDGIACSIDSGFARDGMGWLSLV